jgi:cell wall-associated protease
MKRWQSNVAVSMLAGISHLAQGSVVAIIDSGLDYKHQDLQSQIWVNPSDSTFDEIDDDQNGIVDDVHGMNFIDQNGKVIDYSYGRLFNKEIEKFFNLQAKAIEGLATQEELDFMKKLTANPLFLRRLMTYGNYAHGTHVAGVSASLGKDNKVLAIKLIPTASPFAAMKSQIQNALADGKEMNWIVKNIIKLGLTLLAETQGQLFAEVGKIVHSYGADVANASLGIGPTQAKNILLPLLTLAQRGQAPSEELLNEMVTHLLNEMNRTQKKLVTEAPETLFIFAAGNDGSNNDLFPTAPASIDHPQVISVAAATGKGNLAPFSNYGKKVDLAAPGVGIDSSVPDQKRLPLSGTSQAAPFIAGLAAELKNRNPKLKPLEIKRIILETTDALSSESDRTTAFGHVNRDRALLAGDYSNGSKISQAITAAFKDLPRKTIEQPASLSILNQDFGPLPMPSLFE